MTHKIYIVEDHPAMRCAYKHLFNHLSDIELCGQSKSGEDALKQIPQREPNLVLVDISLPDMDGFELIERLNRVQPALPVLIVSGHDRQAFAAQPFKDTVQGYVMKAAGPQTLVNAIRQSLG